MICGTCKQEADSLDEADDCEECHDKWFAEEAAYWWPLYQGEKLAGLIKDKTEYPDVWREE